MFQYISIKHEEKKHTNLSNLIQPFYASYCLAKKYMLFWANRKSMERSFRDTSSWAYAWRNWFFN